MKKAQKQGFQRKKSRAGNTRRAQKAADEVAEKQNVSQKRGKIQTAWQDVISEAKMTSKGLTSKPSRGVKGGLKCQRCIGENMQSANKQQMKQQRSRTCGKSEARSRLHGET